MKYLPPLLALLFTPAWGQLVPLPPPPAVIAVTVQYGPVKNVWPFYLGVPIFVVRFSCTQPAGSTAPNATSTLLMPGNSSTCVVTLNQPAPMEGVKVQVTIPAPLTGGPPDGWLSIPPGALFGTFTVTYPATTPVEPQAALPIVPMAYSVSAPGQEVQRYASVQVPCCAQEGLCGLPVERVAMEPCQ